MIFSLVVHFYKFILRLVIACLRYMKLCGCDENDLYAEKCKLINKALPNLIVNISNVLWYSIDPMVINKLGFVPYMRTWEFLQQPINTSCCGEVRNLTPWQYNQYF